MNKMLTINQLQKECLNGAIIDLAFNESQKRMRDLLDAKQELEKKAFTLLAGYLAASVSFVGLLITSEAIL